jgi:hypothetical protein
MRLTRYTVSRRFRFVWAWHISHGPGAPAAGIAMTKQAARSAARSRIRTAKARSAIDRQVDIGECLRADQRRGRATRHKGSFAGRFLGTD